MERKNNDDNKKKILIIDDEADITFTFKTGLEDTGLFTVDTVNHPQDALFNFKPSMYDLLLIDIRMPNRSGYELYKEIRKKESSSKGDLCGLPANPLNAPKKYFQHSNKNYYILKPIEINELIKRINDIIAPKFTW